MNVEFALVHGGVHTSRAWTPLLPHLASPAVAIDLPGRVASPANLRDLTLQDFADALTKALESMASDRIVLVGHSLAGVILPLAAAQVADRIEHVVFISCTIPPSGSSVVDTLPPGLQGTFRLLARQRECFELPRPLGRWMFCNGLDPDERAVVLGQLCPEAWGLVLDPVPEHVLPPRVPRTYIVLRRDHALPVWFQRRQARNVADCAVIDLDAGHEAFISQPRALAAILNGIASAR